MKKLVAFSVVCYGAFQTSAQSLNPINANESEQTMVESHNQAVSVNTIEDFQVVLNGEQAQISWNTRSLDKTRGFLLEKSTNGNQFESLVFIAAESGVSGKVEYLETDTSVAKGINYYRIRQVYFNGYEALTNAVVVKRRVPETGEDEIVDEFGNYIIKVDFSGFENEETLVILRDQKGYEYFTKLYIVQTDAIEKGVRIEPALPAGEYLVTGSSNDQFLAHKLAIE
ncbi:MAG: hypothetical protein ACHQF2_07065 [Flavobacteriales bacterium]